MKLGQKTKSVHDKMRETESMNNRFVGDKNKKNNKWKSC